MEVHELVIEMKLLERRMTLYEEKYGVLSEDFYVALMAGELADYDAHDETRADFSRWKGIFETWKRRKGAYQEKLQERELAKLLRFQQAGDFYHAIALCDDLLARADLPERLRHRVMEYAHSIRIRRDQWYEELISEAA